MDGWTDGWISATSPEDGVVTTTAREFRSGTPTMPPIADTSSDFGLNITS